MKFRIVYAFTDVYGKIEQTADGVELYRICEVEAQNKQQALDVFYLQERFKHRPEYIEVIGG